MANAFDDSYVLYATGAYGRDANLKDWLVGLDFRTDNGSYFSIRDMPWALKDGCIAISFKSKTKDFKVTL